MVIDMHAPGVEVRPLEDDHGRSRSSTRCSSTDVFVPDDDVVGPIDGGWTVARATLGNESVSIGGGQGAHGVPPDTLLTAFDAASGSAARWPSRVGRYIAHQDAMRLLNLRSVHRAVAGSGPGPEGAMTKLVLSELATRPPRSWPRSPAPEIVVHGRRGASRRPARAHAPRACPSPAARRRSSATRSASGSSACPAIR